MTDLVVGFDLDLTLADSAAGIGAVYRRLAEEFAVSIDVGLVTSRLGPPLEIELAHWFPAERIAVAKARYRELYADVATPLTVAMPGADAALDAVRAAGGRSVVVTAKHASTAQPTLERLGFDVDRVFGGVWADQKGGALREAGARIFVGDHEGDMRGARTADVVAVGVTTGPCGPAQLYAAGADIVLPDLSGFPAWLHGWVGSWVGSAART